MDLALLLARLSLAVLFLVAAVSKLLGGFANSRKALADFGIPSWLVGSSSIVLPCAELITGFLLIPATSARLGSVSALTLLLLFNGAIATNLALGRRPNCNCFGQLHSAPIGWRTFARNSVLIALAGWIGWQAQHSPSPSLSQAIHGFSAKEIVVIVSAILTFAAIGGEALVMLQLFRQNGRLLLRMEALERKFGGPTHGNGRPAIPKRHGLPIGSPAPGFELLEVSGVSVGLDYLLKDRKPVLLIFSDTHCNPCNSLLPGIGRWQRSLESSLRIAIIGRGTARANRAKALEHRL